MLRRLDSLVRKSLVVADHRTERTGTASRHDPPVRRGASRRRRPARGGPRQARGVLRPRGGPSLGAVGRPEWRGPSTGCRPSWPTCARRTAGAAPRPRRDGHRRGRARRVDGLLVELFETVGWAEALLDAAARAPTSGACRVVRGRGLRLLRRRPAGRESERTPGDRARGRPGTSPASRVRGVHRGAGAGLQRHLDRYLELTREVAGLPGAGAPTRSRRTSTACSPRDTSTPRWRSSTRRSRRPASSAPGLARLHAVDRRAGLLEGGPERALAAWDEGTDVVARHGVRFFEGFMSRDARCSHVPRGVERPLSLF